MIVVLVVIAILAGGFIGSASGYARRATLTQNDSNAETIYQAAQTALQQMQKAGGISSPSSGGTISINSWVTRVTNSGVAFAFAGSNLSQNMTEYKTAFSEHYQAKDIDYFKTFDAAAAKANKSIHMRYVLNYSQGNASSPQSVLVKELIQPYFHDSSVFAGAITIELDLEKSADSYGKLHCSAKCLSVFYDSRAKNGFSSLSTDNTVPSRSTSYRAEKSLIGYYDGYKGTVIDTVFLPKVQEGIVVKKFETENTTETIDIKNDADEIIEQQEVTHAWITWASTLDTANLNGSRKDVYYRLALLKGDTEQTALFLNEDFLLQEDAVGNARHSIDYSQLASFNDKDEWTEHPQRPTVTVEQYPVVYNGDSGTNKFTKTITRKSVTVNARVYVKPGDFNGYRNATLTDISTNTNSNLLPLRITYVENEYDPGDSSHAKAPYIEYSLDITGSLNDETDGVKITIHPNYFSDTTMKEINDEKGIISFKRGTVTGIDPLPPPKTIPVTTPAPAP
ncbi:MAG: hypothetical protein K6E60_05895 [Saccharofermentans sp.]|nr:hypothetical protein [Saccharofermentans sp.]